MNFRLAACSTRLEVASFFFTWFESKLKSNQVLILQIIGRTDFITMLIMAVQFYHICLPIMGLASTVYWSMR
jgi:hypothetical protein